MLKQFQLAAIVKKGNNFGLFRIPLHQGLQNKLAHVWFSQYNSFSSNIREISFNPGYNPDGDERFCIMNYCPPDWLRNVNCETIRNCEVIGKDDVIISSITGIVGFARNEQDNELMLFQNFSRSHVIRPGHFLFLDNDTYKTTERPGLTLGTSLSAVYFTDERKLLFRNLSKVNSFLSLADYYQEASEEEIREILNHPIFAAEDPDAIAVGSNQWFRKRIAMVRDSGILDRYSAQDIYRHSQDYDVEIRLEGNRLIFPKERSEAKRLLQFLNEEIFRGAITETLYETNSKKQADS